MPEAANAVALQGAPLDTAALDADALDAGALDPRVVGPSDAGFRPAAIGLGSGNSGGGGGVGSLRDAKERSASRIALIITWTFTGATALLFVGVLVMLIAGRHDPGNVKALLDAGVPALKEICVSLTSLFGPLLAFVLGYYFGEKNKTS